MSKGIHHKKTNAYTPQENGVSEQMNHTLVESTWSMLHDASLTVSYWGDAILYMAHMYVHILKQVYCYLCGTSDTHLIF